jgi:hypothetical protein
MKALHMKGVMTAGLTSVGPLTIAFALALAGTAGVKAADDADEIVKRADLVRGPADPFTLKMDVTAYRGSKVLNSTSVLVNTHDFSRSLVEFVAPPRDAGRKLLRVSENMWVRIPASRRAIRITPQQRLLGQASNADVMGTNYASDYSSKLLGEEEVTSHDGAKVNCYKLELVKKTVAASYYRLIYWVDKASYRPVRTEFYTQTGKLIKYAQFGKFGNALGAVRPGRVVIVNAVNADEYTVLDILEYGNSRLPVAQYTEAALN